MMIALYRWKIREGLEQQFVDAWSGITRYYLENHGSLGSRLHRGSDGLFYGYAQWPSAERRNDAFSQAPELPEWSLMLEAIEESYPEVLLDLEADFLVPLK